MQAGLSRLVDHHQDLCKSLFYNILEDTNHRLHHLLPPHFSTSYSLRNPRTFDIKFNTKRAKNTFFNAQCHLVNSFVVTSLLDGAIFFSAHILDR